MTQPTVLDAAGAAAASEAAAMTGERFEVLDSWRGICALLVALHHFPTNAALTQTAFVGSSYLFVDFFFVLSGFVIAGSYRERLGDLRQVSRFALVRFGRIYPLHLVMILAILAFEVHRLIVHHANAFGVAPFTESTDPRSLVENLLLLHGIGIEHRLTWNEPSWSISAEFFTYLLFAGVVLFARRRAWVTMALAAVAAPLLIYRYSPTFMDTTYDLGLVRSVYGFSLGALLSWFFRDAMVSARGMPLAPGERLLWTVIEAAAIFAMVQFVVEFGGNAGGIAAPFLFVIALYVFAHEGGWISALLRTGPMLWLGTLSYSIYMVHMFVQRRMINLAQAAQDWIGEDLTGYFQLRGDDSFGFNASSLENTVAIPLMIAMVLAASWLTWRLAEMPALNWFRRLSRRI